METELEKVIAEFKNELVAELKKDAEAVIKLTVDFEKKKSDYYLNMPFSAEDFAVVTKLYNDDLAFYEKAVQQKIARQNELLDVVKQTFTPKKEDTKENKREAKELKGLKETITAFTAIRESGKTLSGAFSGLNDDISKVFSTIGTVGEGAETITNKVQTLASSASNAVGKAADGAANLADTTKAVGEGVKGAGNAAAQSMSTVEKASAILAVIAAAIQIAMALIKAFDSSAKKQEKLNEQIDELKKKYNELGDSIKKAFGTDYYQKKIDQTKNLTDQIAKINQKINAEENKCWLYKTDKSKIREWENDKRGLIDKITEVKDEIFKELMTTDLKSFASGLADSLVSAFENGTTNMGGGVDQKINAMLNKVITKQFDVIFIQKALSPLFNYAEKAFEDFTLSESELNEMLSFGVSAKKDILAAWPDVRELLDKIGLSSSGQGLTGAIKGITEETASMLAGQMNAIRTLQAQALEVQRQQLQGIKNLVSLSVGVSGEELNRITKGTIFDDKIQRDSLSQLERISQNTYNLVPIREAIEKIEKFASGISGGNRVPLPADGNRQISLRPLGITKV